MIEWVKVWPTWGEPTAGLWCTVCSLPSLVTWPVLGLGDDLVADMDPLTVCTEHDEMTEAIDRWRSRYNPAL